MLKTWKHNHDHVNVILYKTLDEGWHDVDACYSLCYDRFSENVTAKSLAEMQLS